jgi:transcriptional regulator with XRE-family HTH domain
MRKLGTRVGRQISKEEQDLRDVLSANIKKYRARKAWSQFALAEKIDISTNFLADIEAGNTWVSSLTLVKLAKAFDIEAHELFKPAESDSAERPSERDDSKTLMDRFSKDLMLVLLDSVEKAVEHVRGEYLK